METSKNRFATFYRNVGLPRIIIFVFLIALCIAMPVLQLQTVSLLAQAVTRIFMNMVLVLAMVPSIECGIGMNYGLPLGVICGLFGGAVSMELGLSGAPCFFLAMLIGVVLGAGVGWGYAQLLNRVVGQENMISTYIGFSAVSFMCMVWMILPVHNSAIRWPMGTGLRSSVELNKFFYHILNGFLEIEVSASASIPVGLILFVLLLCVLMALFQRSHLGIVMKTAGSNPRYAKAIGINVNRMRCTGMMISSALAAIGIQVYAQSYGFMEYYAAPLKIAFTAAAAVLIGGATNRKASVANVIIGTVLFQGLLTIALPVANQILPESSLSEIVRIVISNGIILYALTKAGDKNG